MYILHLLIALRNNGIEIRLVLSEEQVKETTLLKGLKKYPTVIEFKLWSSIKRLTVMNPDEIIGVLLALCTVLIGHNSIYGLTLEASKEMEVGREKRNENP